jgi:protein subunit release factor B
MERVLSVTLADCDVQTKRGSGKGGQNRNKRDTAVRIVHPASGAVGESQEERSQLQNKRTAFLRMVDTNEFRLWMRKELGRKNLIDVQVSEQMRPRNLKMEVQLDGKWVEISPPSEWWE